MSFGRMEVKTQTKVCITIIQNKANSNPKSYIFIVFSLFFDNSTRKHS